MWEVISPAILREGEERREGKIAIRREVIKQVTVDSQDLILPGLWNIE
jgi:hypothetical protein